MRISPWIMPNESSFVIPFFRQQLRSPLGLWICMHLESCRERDRIFSVLISWGTQIRHPKRLAKDPLLPLAKPHVIELAQNRSQLEEVIACIYNKGFWIVLFMFWCWSNRVLIVFAASKDFISKVMHSQGTRWPPCGMDSNIFLGKQ